MGKYRICLSLFLLGILAFPANSQHFSYNEHKEFSGYSDFVYQASYSPFRNYFAITNGTNTLEIFDSNWKRVFRFQGNPESRAGIFVFSPDEKFMAYARYKSDNDIAIIELESFRVKEILHGHSQLIKGISFSNDGKMLASCSTDKTVLIWKYGNDRFSLHQECNEHEETVSSVSFSYDDTFFASCGNDGKIEIRKLHDGKYEHFQTIGNFRGYMYDIVFHPLVNDFLTADSYNLKYFKLKNNRFSITDSLADKIKINNYVNFSPTGDHCVFGSYSNIKIHGIEKGRFTTENGVYRHTEHTFGGSFSSDGKFLTTCGVDKKAIVWTINNIPASSRSMVADFMGGKLTLAMKQVLTPAVAADITGKLPNDLVTPRDEFETTAEYNERRQRLEELVQFMLQHELEKKYCSSSNKEKVTIRIDEITGYNADLQIYKIKFMETGAGINIPVAEARSFKEKWMKGIIMADKKATKENKSITYTNFRLVHPVDGTFDVTPLENPFNIKSEKLTTRTEDFSLPDNHSNFAVSSGDNKDMLGSNSRALLFATNIYDSYNELVNPVNDAITIGNELKDNYGFSIEIAENFTLNEIVSKLREYAGMSYSPGDKLFIFFAGHGTYDEVFREGYVIARDSKRDDITKTTYLSHSNLRTIVNNIPCDHVLLMMDVCFGGTFDPLIASKSRAADPYGEISKEEFISRKSNYKTRLYITSGGKEYVPDGRPGYHSPFARKFLEALRGYGGSDGILTVSEIVPYIEKVSPQPRFGEFGDNEPGSDFLFIGF